MVERDGEDEETVEDIAFRGQRLLSASIRVLASELKKSNDPKIVSLISDRIFRYSENIDFAARSLRSKEARKRDKEFYSKNTPVWDTAVLDELAWLDIQKAELGAKRQAEAESSPRTVSPASPCLDNLERPPPQCAPNPSQEQEPVEDAMMYCDTGSNALQDSIFGQNDDMYCDREDRVSRNSINVDDIDDESNGTFTFTDHFDTVMVQNDRCIDQIEAECMVAETPVPRRIHLLLLPFDPNTPVLNVIAGIFAGKLKFEHFEWIIAYQAHILDSKRTLAGHAKRRRSEKAEKNAKMAFVSVSKNDSLCSVMHALEPEGSSTSPIDRSSIVAAAKAATKAANKGNGQYAWEQFVRAYCRELMSIFSYLTAQIRTWRQVTLNQLIEVCGERGRMREALEDGKGYFGNILRKDIGSLTIVEVYENALIPAMCTSLPSFDPSTESAMTAFTTSPATADANKKHAYDMASVMTSKFSSKTFVEQYKVAEAVPISRPYLSVSDEERASMLDAKSSSFFCPCDDNGTLTDAGGVRRKRSGKLPRMVLLALHSQEILSLNSPQSTSKLGPESSIFPLFFTPTEIGNTKFDSLFDRRLIIEREAQFTLKTVGNFFKKKGLLEQLTTRIEKVVLASKKEYAFADLTDDLRNDTSKVRRLFTWFQNIAYGEVGEDDEWKPVDEDDNDGDDAVEAVPV